MQIKKWFVRIAFGVELIALFLLAVLSVSMHSNYGNGLSYFTFIILPLISISIGFLGLITKKWWVVTTVCSIFGTLYLYIKSTSNLSFLFLIVFYAVLSIVVGYTSQQLLKQKK